MKKIIILIFTVILLTNCKSHKEFYAYEDKEESIYIVLEHSTKYPVLKYRAYDGHNFIFIEGTKSGVITAFPEMHIFFNMIIINKEDVNVCTGREGMTDLAFKYRGYREELLEDKLYLIENNLEKIKCIKELRIHELAPYLVKVKKIDYSKFPEDFRDVVKEVGKNRKNIYELHDMVKNKKTD